MASHGKYALLFVFAAGVSNLPLRAEGIDLTIINPNRFGSAGFNAVFQGTITNTSGLGLNSTDLFLNFSGYDSVNVTLTQVLGLTNFLIPNGTTSGIVDL